MTKVEILQVVKEMQKDWQMCIDTELEPYEYCKTGFCNYLIMTNIMGVYLLEIQTVICELSKDLQHILKEHSYWYLTYYTQKRKEAFIPRLDHLNRTIARLENEIKLENATI